MSLLTWQIGAVKVIRAVESTRAIPKDLDPPFIPDATPENLRTIPWLYPRFVNAEDQLVMGIQALLVEAPGLRMVVDTCIGTGRDAERPAGPFLDDLALAGWTPESVDIVLCTHLHFDHVGWNTHLKDGAWVPTFPKARYLFGRAEYDHWSKEEGHNAPAILAASVQPIFDAGLADLVETDHVISPELRLIPTTGHTPGHVSVVIESGGSRAVITGDMTHHPCQIARPDWHTNYDSDQAGGCATRRQRLAQWADDGTLVIGTHFAAPTAGHVRRDGQTFRFGD